jgi:hypothetical protein
MSQEVLKTHHEIWDASLHTPIHGREKAGAQSHDHKMAKIRLPSELTDRIIDFLYSDRRTLAVCSLVCRSWVPASRLHYFQKLVVRPTTVDHLIELICTPSSTISKLTVQCLEFRDHDGLAVFIKIAHYISKFTIQKLVLRFLQWTYPTDAISRCLERIPHLEIIAPEFLDLTGFIRFIQSFHSLHTLQLYNGCWAVNSSNQLLYDLFLDDMNRLPRSVSMAQFPAITILKLHNIPGGPVLRYFLQSLGPSLSKLEILFKDMYPGKLRCDFVHRPLTKLSDRTW